MNLSLKELVATSLISGTRNLSPRHSSDSGLLHRVLGTVWALTGLHKYIEATSMQFSSFISEFCSVTHQRPGVRSKMCLWTPVSPADPWKRGC